MAASDVRPDPSTIGETVAFAVLIALGWAVVLWVTWPTHVFPADVLGIIWLWAELLLWLVVAVCTLAASWLAWRRASAVLLVLGVVTAGFAVTQTPLSPRLLLWEGRPWFESHRADFDAAAGWAEASGCCGASTYGDELPDDLSWLSVDGRVSGGERGFFFAQWYGIPDDAGGFWHVGSGSPEGYDMAGMECTDPVDLSDGWWMCGMTA